MTRHSTQRLRPGENDGRQQENFEQRSREKMKGNDVEAITKLLKEHDVPLSAVKANKLMLKLGLLEEATRESSTRPGVIKKYKVLSEKGLDFGVNEENPQSPEQTSPYYYKDSFPELARILIEASEAEAK